MVTLLASVPACGAPPADQPEPLHGADLVAGTSLDRHGLLVISKQPGVAEFRSIDDPSTIRWTGRLTLPAATAAHGLGRTVVLRHEGGASLYTPSPESLTPLPNVPPQARWIGSFLGGAFVANGWALTVTASGSRVVTADGEILWAAPTAGDRVVALIDAPAGPKLAVWEGSEEVPSNTRAVGTRGPVVLAGWGGEVVSTSDDSTRLVSWSIPDLESTEVLQIEGAAAVLATSPSQHRIYAATVKRPQLLAVDRYEWEVVGSIHTDLRFLSLRISVTGDWIVAYDGMTVWSMQADKMSKIAIPGQWRPDFPITLSGGSILVADPSGLRVFGADGAYIETVDGPLDAWWLPLRWGPRAPVTAVALAPEDTVEQLDLSQMSSRGIGLMTMGSTSGSPSPVVPRRQDPTMVLEESLTPVDTRVTSLLHSGFYVVAISSRQLLSLKRLERALERSGYSTHVMPRVDEANDMWYRLLVGPYVSREAAETVTRELRRERGIDGWIHEVEG